MKRRIFLCLLTVLCLLTGCASNDNFPAGENITCKDIAFTVPGDFLDLSEESYAGDADFMFGKDTLIFTGLAEHKDTFLEKMTLEQYTGYVISGNKLDCAAETYGSGYRFSYEKQSGDKVLSYVVATYEGPSCFWIFQFYCPKGDLEKNLPEIDIVLSAVRPA